MKICGNFVFNGNTLISYSGQDTELTIPEGTVKISGAVFGGNKTLTRISLPESIIDIGSYCDCRSLETINIPSKVTFIPNHAFRGCTSLTDIALPDSIVKIGLSSFSGCKKLTSISLPDAIVKLPEMAFCECRQLKTVKLPKNLTEIGDMAFSGCIRLQSLVLPDGVVKIGQFAFQDCKKLTEVILPDGLNEIKDSTFCNCVGLKAVYLPPTVKKIHKNSFLLCRDLTIHGVSGSFAEAFAKKENIPFSTEPLPGQVRKTAPTQQQPSQKPAPASKPRKAAPRSIKPAISPLEPQPTGEYKTMQQARRALVDNCWSIEIPIGYLYCTDPARNAENTVSGLPHLLEVQSWYDANFQAAYESDFNLTIYGNRFDTAFNPSAPLTAPENAAEIEKWETIQEKNQSAMRRFLGQTEGMTCQIRQTPEIAVYCTFNVRNETGTSGSIRVYLPKENGLYLGYFSIYTDVPSSTREALIRAWLGTIEPSR